MPRKFLSLLLVSVALALPACNTVRGLGEDLQSVANEVDRET